MAELASPVPYQLKIPDNGQFYQPQNLPFRNWSPADFEGAYQFAPKPVSPDAYMGIANGIGTLANQFTPQTQAANAQARLAGSLASNTSGALATAAQNQTTDAALNNGSAPQLVAPTSNLSDRPTMNGAPAPNLAPNMPTASTDGVSNASAPMADGSRTGLATVFAGSHDLDAYNKAIAEGKSEQEALAVGDNGIGKWGAKTSNPNNLHVALSLSTLAAHGISEKDAPGTPVTVQYNGKSVAATVGDVLPENSKNGAAIDINPGVANALGVDPNNFKDQVAFSIGAIHNAPTATAPIAPASSTATANSDLPQNSSPPTNGPLFGLLPNVAGSSANPIVPNSSGLAAANRIANGPQIPIGSDVPTAKAVPAPVIAPTVQPAPVLAPSAWQQRLTSALGSGHITVDPKGGVSYDTVAPLNALQQSEVNLAPAKLRLTQAEIDQSQQKLDQERIMGPLTAQVEQAKIAATQRQFEAAQQAAKSSGPVTVPAGGLPNANSTTSAAADPNAPFSPGHVLVRQFTLQPKDGALIQGENPVAKETLAGARLSGVPLDEHIKLLDPNTLTPSPTGEPFLDTTSAQHAMGTGAVSMRQGAATASERYIQAQAALDSLKSYAALSPAQRNGFGDNQALTSYLQTEAPGAVPSGQARRDLLGDYGYGDVYDKYKNKLGAHDPAFLSDQQVQDMLSAANASTLGKAKVVGMANKGGVGAVAQNALDEASKAKPSVAPSGMVQMRSPSGKLGNIPNNSETIKAAQAKGFTLL